MSFFFNDTATTEIYTLSLHDALPIYLEGRVHVEAVDGLDLGLVERAFLDHQGRPTLLALRRALFRRLEQEDDGARQRSEEHTSELQSPDHLVCRLLLEKKKPESICTS